MSIQNLANVGLDVGGANLKFAATGGSAWSEAFPMWQEWRQLEQRIVAGLGRILPDWNVRLEHLALTLTGELADCFASRRQGVRHIVEAAAGAVGGSRVRVYAVGGEWLDCAQAIAEPWRVAAGNWHALALWVGCTVAADWKRVMLLDIGSTTTDVIPIRNGQVGTDAKTDRDRLADRQLVYTGLERTPVAAILPEAKLAGRNTPLMAERFADSLDAYLAIGTLPEQESVCDTADGRPRTRACAVSRLARMVGEDDDTLPLEQILEFAEQIIQAQVDQIYAAVAHNRGAYLDGRIDACVLSGHGAELATRVVRRWKQDDQALAVMSLEELWGIELSRCAPAWAVAQLLLENGKALVRE